MGVIRCCSYYLAVAAKYYNRWTLGLNWVRRENNSPSAWSIVKVNSWMGSLLGVIRSSGGEWVPMSTNPFFTGFRNLPLVLLGAISRPFDRGTLSAGVLIDESTTAKNLTNPTSFDQRLQFKYHGPDLSQQTNRFARSLSSGNICKLRIAWIIWARDHAQHNCLPIRRLDFLVSYNDVDPCVANDETKSGGMAITTGFRML